MESSKKCYVVSLKNVIGYPYINSLPEIYKVYAVKLGNDLKEIVTGKKILVSDVRILDPKEFILMNADLFGIDQVEISKEEFLSKIELLKNSNINDYIKMVLAFAKETKRLANKRYDTNDKNIRH